MADLTTWGRNIYLLLGLLLCLAAGAVVGAVLWTGLKVWLWRIRQRRAWKQYRQKNRRVDGQKYPPCTGGVCDQCGKVSNKIYHPVSGPRLCSPCYETYWRETELFARRPEKAKPQAEMRESPG